MAEGIDAIEVRTSEELGRYLVATRDLAPGDVVLTEKPMVFGPRSLLNSEECMPCVGCYKLLFTEVGERCAKCGWPVCSGNCPGLRDPRHHGLECKILSARPECEVAMNNMSNYYRHDALFPLRCGLLQKSDPEKWKMLLEMESHMEGRLPGTEEYDGINEHVAEYLMNEFINKLDEKTKSEYLPEISLGLIHKICGIIEINALEIRLPDKIDLVALYAKTYLMEHSCIPNTKHSFNLSPKDKGDLYKITIKVVVPTPKYGHVATMYSHALWGTQARRLHLKELKYFWCKCLRCSDPTELGTYFSALKCLGDDNNNCDGIHLPEDPLDNETDWACNKCPNKVNNLQINMLMDQMAEEVSNVQCMGGSVPTLESLLCRLSTFLHPNHYHLYSIKHSLVQLYGRKPGFTSVDILDKKITMCKDLIMITKVLDPGNARLSLYTSVLHHELHSALVMKSSFMKKDNYKCGKKSVKKMKQLLIEAKDAIEFALNSLKDDTDETSGKKLFEVLVNSKKEFKKYCKELKLTI